MDIKRRNRIIRNLVLFFAVCIAISALVFGILWWTKVLYVDGGIHFNTELFSDLRGTFWIKPVFIAMQVVITVLLCFVPGTSAAMILAAVALFGSGWRSFAISAIGVLISSFAMYAVGRFGGNRLIERILGKEDTDRAVQLMREHGQLYFPVMLACAGFPDDALVMVAGMMKMNFGFFSLSVLLGRGIGIATICFGINLLPEITCFWDVAEIATVCGFWLCVVFYLTHRLNIYINKRKQKQNTKKEGTQDGELDRQ